MKAATTVCILALVSLPCVATAQLPREQAPVLRALLDCRTIADSVARLACYDGKAEAFAAAEKSGDVVVADKAQIKQTKKALFGFGSVKLPIFGGRDDVEAPSQIEATIRSLRDLGHGKYEFTLDNGMRWRQTDDEEIFPRVGMPVTVKVAAMGSYMMKVKARAVRVMRVQ